jgi:hypothetical protein
MSETDKFRFKIIAEFRGATVMEALDRLRRGDVDCFTTYDTVTGKEVGL